MTTHHAARAGAAGARLRIESPIGRLLLAGDEVALTHVFLPGATTLGETPGAVPAPLRMAAAQLDEYFAGTRKAFSLPLALQGTAFQLAVWKALADIGYGETITYGELASRVGRPAAFRAVGQANGANPVPIVYPCHRVVAAGSRLGGYGGGLDVKRRLLALEGATASGW
ncbi:MAG TPA: methylated-DNA--[protein]-cysteine S-methyltransferase [Acidimicrobiales bacterium]|nr:methylated-DNA--[protein]-cysteine S-methyltransferase [Acidimicrobiales bacterium]